MSPEELKALTVFPERDLIGYGPDRPDPKWPNGAKIAVNFVIVRVLPSLQLLVLIRIQNYEEGAASASGSARSADNWSLGAENTIANGDEGSEVMLQETGPVSSLPMLAFYCADPVSRLLR